jgi:hypothetical protein
VGGGHEVMSAMNAEPPAAQAKETQRDSLLRITI